MTLMLEKRIKKAICCLQMAFLMASAPTVICSELRIGANSHIKIMFRMIILNVRIVKQR